MELNCGGNEFFNSLLDVYSRHLLERVDRESVGL